MRRIGQKLAKLVPDAGITIDLEQWNWFSDRTAETFPTTDAD
jgi:hypothetical protein